MSLHEATLPERVAVEVARLDGLASKHARRELSRWWVRRHDSTARWPESLQHRLAAGVLDSMPPNSVAAFRRAITSRDTAA